MKFQYANNAVGVLKNSFGQHANYFTIAGDVTSTFPAAKGQVRTPDSDSNIDVDDSEMFTVTLVKADDPTHQEVLFVRDVVISGSDTQFETERYDRKDFSAGDLVELRATKDHYSQFLQVGLTREYVESPHWEWVLVDVKLQALPTVVLDEDYSSHDSVEGQLTVRGDVKAFGVLSPGIKVAYEWQESDMYGYFGNNWTLESAVAVGALGAMTELVIDGSAPSSWVKYAIRFVITDDNNPEFIYRTKYWIIDGDTPLS